LKSGCNRNNIIFLVNMVKLSLILLSAILLIVGSLIVFIFKEEEPIRRYFVLVIGILLAIIRASMELLPSKDRIVIFEDSVIKYANYSEDYIYGQIDTSIVGLEDLIDNNGDEIEFRNWIITNHYILRLLGADKVIFGPILNLDTYTSPLLFAFIDDKWHFIYASGLEIQNADSNQINTLINTYYKRTKLIVTDDFKEAFYNNFGHSIDYSVPIIIFFGKSIMFKGIDLSDNRKNTIIYPYDYLLHYLTFHCDNRNVNKSETNGFSAYIVLNIFKIASDNYILDFGDKKDRDRMSLFISKSDFLTLRLIDRNGEIYESKTNIIDYYNNVTLVIFEICIENKIFSIKLSLNGILKYNAIFSLDDFSVPDFWVIGSDMLGKEDSGFGVYNICIFNRSLRLQERWNMFEYLYLKKVLLRESFGSWVEFKGHKFMYTNNHPLYH